MSFMSTTVSKNDDFGNAEEEFRTRKSSATILHMLHNAIHVFEVFPDKLMYSRVFGNGFECSVMLYVAQFRSFDRYVGDIRNVGLQYIGDVVVKYRDRIGPTHRKGDKSKCAKRGFKCHIIARGFCN